MKTIFAVPRNSNDKHVDNFFTFEDFDSAFYYCLKNDIDHFFEAESLQSEIPIACFFLRENDDEIFVVRVGEDECECGDITIH